MHNMSILDIIYADVCSHLAIIDENQTQSSSYMEYKPVWLWKLLLCVSVTDTSGSMSHNISKGIFWLTLPADFDVV